MSLSLILLAAGYPAELSRPANASVELYYVESPLMSSYAPTSIRELMLALQGYHAGLAFRHANGSLTTLEYDARDGLVAGVVPDVANGSITWSNFGIVRSIPFNASYWRRASLLGRLDEATLDSFLEWVSAYNATVPDYNGLEVVSASSGVTQIRSATCSDFAAVDAITELRRLGVPISPLVPTRKSRAVLHSAEPPTRVEPDDRGLVRYWSVLSRIVHAVLGPKQEKADAEEAAVADGYERFEKVAYVRMGGLDYRVVLAPPFATFTYDVAPVPP